MARTDPAVDLLRAVPLFADLSKSELGLVASIRKRIEFDPGDKVVTEGQSTGRFFVIIEGDADVIVGDRFIRRLGTGDFFGEMALNAQRSEPGRRLGHRLGRFTTIPSCVERAMTTTAGSSREGFSSRWGT